MLRALIALALLAVLALAAWHTVTYATTTIANPDADTLDVPREVR